MVTLVVLNLAASQNYLGWEGGFKIPMPRSNLQRFRFGHFEVGLNMCILATALHGGKLW